MAIVSVGYEVTVDLRDTSNSSSILTYDLTAATFAEANTARLAIIAALDPMTLSAMRSVRLTEVFEEDAFNLPAGAENAIKAEITGLLFGSPIGVGRVQIPAPTNAAGVIWASTSGAGNNIVNGGTAEVLAYMSLFEEGTGEATIANGRTLIVPVSQASIGGKRISRGSRNP